MTDATGVESNQAQDIDSLPKGPWPYTAPVVVGSLTFALAFYATGLAFLLAGSALLSKVPVLPEPLSFVLIMELIYALFVLTAIGSAVLWKASRVEDPSPSIAKGTGLQAVETAGLVVSALALLVVSLMGAYTLVPLVLAASIPLGVLARQPRPKNPVGAPHLLYVPVNSARWDPDYPDDADLDPADMPPGYEVRHYEWTFSSGLASGERWTADVPINIALYEQMRDSDADRFGGPNPFADIVMGGITAEVARLAARLRAISRAEGYGTYDEIMLTAAFVQQNIPYAHDVDSKGREYWRYPIETLYDLEGDCDCKALLLAAVLVALGYDCVILLSSDPAHLAVGVGGLPALPGVYANFKGNEYYYLESAASGWIIGELPGDMRMDDFKIYDMPKRVDTAATRVAGN